MTHFSVSSRLVVTMIRSLLLALLGWYFFCLFVPPGAGDRWSELSFPQGHGIRDLAEDLKQQGLIHSSWHFVLLGMLRGKVHQLKAGDYRMHDAMGPAQILDKIAAGKVDYLKFSLPEGYSIYQAAELVEKQGVFDRDRFLAACRNPEILARYSIAGTSVEGYLYPATYNLPRNGTPEQLISRMAELAGKKYRVLATERAVPARMSRHELLTLASLVEKEAVHSGEMPLIASVFYNRLKSGMPLQSDPSAVYGIRPFSGKVTRADIQRNTPYNTYLIPALPPGPIGNPGDEAIRAVLKPAISSYFYFVAKGDGFHHFSRTLDEHNQAVTQYLK